MDCILSCSETSIRYRTGCNERVFQDVPTWCDPISDTPPLCKLYRALDSNKSLELPMMIILDDLSSKLIRFLD